MTILLVVHETSVPALDGMIAGEIAAQRGARFTTLVSGGAGLSRFDCLQHVLRHGELAPNGVLWAERATGHPVEPPVDRGAVARLPAGAVVVPINPAIAAQGEARLRIRATAEALGRPVEEYRVEEEAGLFIVRHDGPDRDGQNLPVSAWTLDAFGRPQPAGRSPRTAAGRPLRILIVAEESQQREVYPANLAALGDAADAIGREVAVAFHDPRLPPVRSWERLLAQFDGVLLPGGSDMEQVAGQIEAARAALRADLPSVGLCLGMQTMSTAVAQEFGGFNDANLAEADPCAQTKTFIRLTDSRGMPEFRLGLRRTRLSPDSRLAALAGGADVMEVHCNHRFVLDPALHARLEEIGLGISGWHEERDIADAVEMPGRRFFMGMQGHPELASRPGHPHPLILGFLTAASERAGA